ncbi:MAG: helix-turn-helix domain-containing protein, partial [Bryobacteraceae bacterium]
PRLLCASHIKPWRDSDNRERLDLYNRLSLHLNYDAAFDAGLITLSPHEDIPFSSQLSAQDAHLVGILPGAAILMRPQHQPYMQHHRANHALARELDTSLPTVLLWRRRFEAEGVDGLLAHDLARGCRTPATTVLPCPTAHHTHAFLRGGHEVPHQPTARQIRFGLTC